ncbi:MAG: hypothetical protein IT270_10015, partial [Saprospiraceae bacterium]|nr:hypothetical protein [Saprospiraceae bacterium]
MLKFATIKGFAFAVLFLTCLNTAFAQTFWTESFSDQASSTANWVNGGTNAGTIDWAWTDNIAAGGFQPGNFGAPTASTGYMWFDSDANGQATHDVTLTGTGNPADCSGKTNVHLKFYTYFRTITGSDVVTVGVSTDGVNFTYKSLPVLDALIAETTGNLPASRYDGYLDVALPEADGQAQVWIQFRYQGTFEYYWKVDDLELYENIVVTCDQNPMAIICDNLESYTVGPVSPQATWWLPWDLNDASAVSGEVSTDFASQGTQSMKIVQDDDQMLLLGNKAAGRYSLKWKQYVPAGNAAYINVQTDQDNPGAATANFSTQIYFNVDGTTTFDIPLPATESTYPQGEWFQLEFIFDLDNNLAKVFLDGALLRAYAYTQNLGAIDFYGADALHVFYVDEVEYVELAPIVFNVDDCGAAVDLTQYFGQLPGVAQTTGLFDNSNATVDPSDPAVDCWNEAVPGADIVDGSMWYTFTGDGANYHIETVPCNATNYIGTAQDDAGDTQMAIYTGSCGQFSLVTCNDDLFGDGMPDWRAGLDLQTNSGTTYYILVDGFNAAGVVATGEYCIEITQEAAVNCANGAVGTYEVANDGNVCWNINLNTLITLDAESFLIPQNGPVMGMIWALSSAPVPAGTWPPSLGASYIGSTGYLQTPFAVGLLNNGSFPAGTYYVTPLIVGGAVDINPANTTLNLTETDVTNGCFFVGESVAVTLLPVLDEIQAVGDVINETVPPGNNGVIELTVEGGYPGFIQDPSSYVITWSNGDSGNPIDGLAGG